jgi:RHH-type proline utilization regulon transcriptional repressor/proline dehydrogenase/delta 1-pyrroline-5-carboxylate dehydrogenase
MDFGMMPNPPPFVKAKKQIEIARGKLLQTDERIELSLQLAASMLQDAHQTQNMEEARMQKRFARMMKDPLGKAFTTMMTDQCFRTNNPKRIANQLCYLLGKMGVPKYLSWIDQLMLRGFRVFGPLFPQLFVPLTKYAIRRETSSVILPGEPVALARHIKQRQLQGIKVNLNHLGEAILGEEEAKKRLQTYLDDLTHQEIDYISIKISTLYSQIQLLAWEDTLQVLC